MKRDCGRSVVAVLRKSQTKSVRTPAEITDGSRASARRQRALLLHAGGTRRIRRERAYLPGGESISICLGLGLNRRPCTWR
jgi:hypothetical protein